MISRLKPLFLLSLCALATPARAQEPLFYKSLAGDSRAGTITAFIGVADSRALQIAQADLNGDGVDEAFVRTPDGSVRVLALPAGRRPLLLGVLDPAKGVQVLDQGDFGVRRLRATGTPANDFISLTYAWNPATRRYEKNG